MVAWTCGRTTKTHFGAPYPSIAKAPPSDLPILQVRGPQHEHFRVINHRMTPARSLLFFRHDTAASSGRITVAELPIQ
jgi:hypothetical protein